MSRFRTTLHRAVRAALGQLAPYEADADPDRSAYPEAGYRSYREQGLQNRFQYYRDLLAALLADKRNRLLPLRELWQATDPQRRLVGLRHDVDADLLMALRVARHNARFGAASSVYVLHTAPYYGHLANGVFFRNPEVRRHLEGLIIAGCEIGLHADPLALELAHGIDGAMAIEQELSYLRSVGAGVVGTAAHNSGPVYGAENFEIFRGRNLWRRPVVQGAKHTARLGVLDERRLGLAYEANAASALSPEPTPEALQFLASGTGPGLRDAGWAKRYFLENPYCSWGADYQFWLIGCNKWLVVGHPKSEPVFLHSVGLDEALRQLDRVDAGRRVVFCVHPIYVSG